MDARLIDIITGVASLAVFIALLALPSLLPGTFTDQSIGYFYIVALALFVVTMSVAGYVVSHKAA
ncbi:MAG: hypothetical protein QMD46_07465 [Methanomicrobiales archaeon]|nr:hypothetical protein [Methanomicrobiales archaeon]MDI6876412.1 hypothetical protein [Methanomicrobiales archaeon]